MRARENCLYIGVGGHVVAINPSTGEEIWRRKLRASTFVTVQVAGDAVLAGAAGELFCLDATTGTIRWRNRLKGLGMGLVAFGGTSEVGVAAAMAAAAAAASVVATTAATTAST
jgi:outer membrane protein assembly factor BamB